MGGTVGIASAFAGVLTIRVLRKGLNLLIGSRFLKQGVVRAATVLALTGETFRKWT